jgi:hypothetical protein
MERWARLVRADAEPPAPMNVLLRVVVSHPFVEEPTNGWGTGLLWN